MKLELPIKVKDDQGFNLSSLDFVEITFKVTNPHILDKKSFNNPVLSYHFLNEIDCPAGWEIRITSKQIEITNWNGDKLRNEELAVFFDVEDSKQEITFRLEMEGKSFVKIGGVEQEFIIKPKDVDPKDYFILTIGESIHNKDRKCKGVNIFSLKYKSKEI